MKNTEDKTLSVIKIGGKVIEDPTALNQFLNDFATIGGAKILVHGGGKTATEVGQQMGIEPNYIDGRRVTDKKTLDLVTMVYAGLVNKNMVAQLQAKEVNAIGLTGADANIITAHKRPIKEFDYGFVGDVDQVNVQAMITLLDMGLVPVICALTYDGKGNLLNTNADTIARVVASALVTDYRSRLIYCFEQKGVFRDIEKQEVVPSLDLPQYEKLKKGGVINEGMIPKIDNAFGALQAGTGEVRIGHYSELSSMLEGDEAGTLIKENGA